MPYIWTQYFETFFIHYLWIDNKIKWLFMTHFHFSKAKWESSCIFWYTLQIPKTAVTGPQTSSESAHVDGRHPHTRTIIWYLPEYTGRKANRNQMDWICCTQKLDVSFPSNGLIHCISFFFFFFFNMLSFCMTKSEVDLKGSWLLMNF